MLNWNYQKCTTLVATFAQKSRMLKTLDTGFVREREVCIGQVGETSGTACLLGKSENSDIGNAFGGKMNNTRGAYGR